MSLSGQALGAAPEGYVQAVQKYGDVVDEGRPKYSLKKLPSLLTTRLRSPRSVGSE